MDATEAPFFCYNGDLFFGHYFFSLHYDKRPSCWIMDRSLVQDMQQLGRLGATSHADWWVACHVSQQKHMDITGYSEFSSYKKRLNS